MDRTEPVVLHKPLLLAKGTNPPICPQCEQVHMKQSHYDSYDCPCCGLSAKDAMVFRIKGEHS